MLTASPTSGVKAVGGEDEMTFGLWQVAILASALLGAALAAGPARSAEPLPGETFRDCEQCDEMVVVPAGSFVMGSNVKASQSPPHKVTLPQ